MSRTRCFRVESLRRVAVLAAAVSLLSGTTIALAADDVPATPVYPAPVATEKPAPRPAGELPPTLVGAWQVRALSIQGSDAIPVQFPGAENRCVVLLSEKTLTLRAGGEVMAEMSYTADLKQTPPTIDAKSADGLLLGIFALVGDALKINLNDAAKGRPRTIDDPGGMILTLQRYVGLPLFVVNTDGSDLRQILAMPEFTNAGSPDWSHDGAKIAIDAFRPLSGENWTGSHVFVVNADGGGLKDLGPGAMPSWSPDDKQLTYCQYTPQSAVWIMNADGSGREMIDADGWGSQWSPKRNEIAYTTRAGGSAKICIYDVATKQRRSVPDKNYKQIYEGFTWSPDGRWICFKGDLPEGGSEIAAVSADGEKNGFKVLLPSSAKPESQNVSKTMSWGGTGSQILLTMQRKTDRVLQMYVLDFSGQQPPQLFPKFPADWTSDDAAWSPDGKQVVFTAVPAAKAP